MSRVHLLGHAGLSWHCPQGPSIPTKAERSIISRSCQKYQQKATYCGCTTTRHVIQEGCGDKQIGELEHAKALPSQCCGCPQQGHCAVAQANKHLAGTRRLCQAPPGTADKLFGSVSICRDGSMRLDMKEKHDGLKLALTIRRARHLNVCALSARFGSLCLAADSRVRIRLSSRSRT